MSARITAYDSPMPADHGLPPDHALPGRSLEDVHRSVQLPTARGFRRFFAFAGPA